MEGLTLTPADRRALLVIAREAIRSRIVIGVDQVGRGDPVDLQGRASGDPPQTGGTLARPCPAFVTLRRGDALRGCIGHLEPDRPLAEIVAQAAVSAAFEDPRFPPVTAEELADLSIEVSVLGPMHPVTDPSTIEVGRHGLVVHSGRRRGLLLPQVAPEFGWDRQTFLEQLCLKAGLSPGAWRTAELFSFEAVVFGDRTQT